MTTPSPEENTRSLPTWLAAPGLFLLALVPRLHAVWLGFVTPDELNWVYRSIRFLQAIQSGRWADTMQTGHPGAITMWLGSLGVLWRRWQEGADTAARLEWIERIAWMAPENTDLLRQLSPFLPPARVVMALFTALGIALVYLLVRRLWGERVALLGAGLLALDPFCIALSGLLHLDAPAMTLMALGILTWLVALDERDAPKLWKRALWAALAGIGSGLSVAAKSPAALAAPVVGLCALLHLLASRPTWKRFAVFVLLGLVWLLCAVGALYAVFPAMWLDPFVVLGEMFGMSDKFVSASRRLQFFMGQVTGNPGPLFYPTVVLFRTTPVTLIGLVLSFVALVRGHNRERVLLISLWGWILGFAGFMMVAEQKYERYLLPIFPAVDLLAALGWQSIVHIVDRNLIARTIGTLPDRAREGLRAQVIGPRLSVEGLFAGTFVVLLVVQGAMVLPVWPYYLDVYNPLAGGLGTALQTVNVGWGEGMDQVAEWIRRQPDASDHVIAAASPVFLVPLIDNPIVLRSDPAQVLADWVVVTFNDRQLASGYIGPSGQLVHRVRFGGRDMLWVYDMQRTAEREHLDLYGATNDVILCDAPSAFARQPGPWEVTVVGDVDEAGIVADLNGWTASHARLWHFSYPGVAPITASILQRQLETYATPLDGVDLGYATATLYILPDEPVFAVGEDEMPDASFDAGLAIKGGLLHEDDLTRSQEIRFRLRWRATSVLKGDYHVFVHLLDEQDHLRVAGGGRQSLVDDRFWPTSLWLVGEGVQLDYALELPPGLPPGRYHIAVGLSDTESGARALALDEQGQIEGTIAQVLSVDVPPLADLSNPALMSLPNPIEVDLGNQIRLLGYGHPSQASVGGTVVVELAWLGLRPFDGDDTLSMALVDGSGATVHEQTLPLSIYPTSLWRTGELVHEMVDLSIPAELDAGSYRLRIDVRDALGISRGPPVDLGEIEISSQDRLFDLPQQPQVPLDLTLGGRIALLGYDLPDTHVRAGETLSVTLYWRCLDPVETSYTVFVHLLDAGGQVQGQQDQPPVTGLAPTSGWVPGQVVIDAYAFTVSASASPSAHVIEVGMYDPRDVTRLPIVDGTGIPLPDDRFLLSPEVMVEE